MSIENLKIVSLAFLQQKYYEGVLAKQYLDYFVKKYPSKSVLLQDCFTKAINDKQYRFVNILTQIYQDSLTNQVITDYYNLLQNIGAREIANELLVLHQNNNELVASENTGRLIVFRLKNE